MHITQMITFRRIIVRLCLVAFMISACMIWSSWHARFKALDSLLSQAEKHGALASVSFSTTYPTIPFEGVHIVASPLRWPWAGSQWHLQPFDKVASIGILPKQSGSVPFRKVPVPHEQLKLFPEIAHLDLVSWEVEDSDLRVLKNFSNLQTLQISDESITDEGLRFVEGMMRLEELRLSHTGVAFHHPVNPLANSPVRVIYAPRTRIDSLGLRSILTIRTLKVLEVWKTEITSIPENSSNSGIEHLHLRGCPLNPEMFSNLAGYKRLMSVDVRNTPLDDRSADTFAQMQLLERLECSYTNMTSAGIERIADCPRLETLVCYGIDLDKAALERLLKHRTLTSFTCVDRTKLLLEEMPDELTRNWMRVEQTLKRIP